MARVGTGERRMLLKRTAFENGKRVEGEDRFVQHADFKESFSGCLLVRASLRMGKQNPVAWENGVPQWQRNPRNEGAMADKQVAAGFDGGSAQEDTQGEIPVFGSDFSEILRTEVKALLSVSLEAVAENESSPVVSFGLADDNRARNMSQLTLWATDGDIDHYGPFARPGSTCDFHVFLNTEKRLLTVQVRCPSDEPWFLLVDDVLMKCKTDTVNRVSIMYYPGAPVVEDFRALPCSEGDRLAKDPEPMLVSGRTCRVRSYWRLPRRHTVVFRKQGVHAGFPDVAEIEPGHLICVWHDNSHTGGEGGYWKSHSRDSGRTWSNRESIQGAARIQRLKDGSLLLQRSQNTTGEDQTIATVDLTFWRSTDGGRTWKDERWLRPKEAGGHNAVVPSRVAELPDGSWMLMASYFTEHPWAGLHPAGGGHTVLREPDGAEGGDRLAGRGGRRRVPGQPGCLEDHRAGPGCGRRAGVRTLGGLGGPGWKQEPLCWRVSTSRWWCARSRWSR